MKQFSIAILTVFVLTGAATPVFAQTDNLKSALQNIATSLDQLAKLPMKEVGKTELESRRATFNTILDLARVESTNLINQLIALDDLDGQYETQRQQLLKQMGNINNYYDTIDTALAGAKTVAATKELARQFANWRKASYHPVLQRVINFLLVFESQAVIATAEKRYANIAADLDKIANLASFKESPLTDLLAQAQESLAGAEELQKAARLIILEDSSNDPQKLIEKALAEVKAAYSSFLEMSDWLKQASKK